MIIKRLGKIKEARNYVRSHTKAEKEIHLGGGPEGRQYQILISFVGRGEDMNDFMQQINAAPVDGISMDLFAELRRDESSSRFKGSRKVLVGRMYDDGDWGSIKIIGKEETTRISAAIRDL